MKEYKNIDEVFEEAAAGFKPELPDSIWEEVNKGVFAEAANKSEFKVYYRYAVVLLLLLVLGSAIWYLMSSPFSSGINNKTIDREEVAVSKAIDDQANAINNQNEEQNALNDGPEVGVTGGANKNTTVSVETDAVTRTLGKDPIFETVKKPTDEAVFENEDAGYVESFTLSGEHAMQAEPDILKLSSRSIFDISKLKLEPIDKPIDVSEYLKQRKKLHLFSGLSSKAAMMYYPNTRDQFTFSVNADFGFVFNDFYVQSGIGYQKTKERGVYNYTYRTNDSIGFYNKVESFEINPQNPEEIIYNTTKTTVYDSLVHVNTTSPLFYYDYINLPVKLGYKVWDKNNLSLSIESGIVFSKLIKSKIPVAEFDLPESTLLQIEDATPTRTDMNLQWQLGLRFNYNIVNSLTLSLQPEFSKYLNSIYKNENSNPMIKPYTMGFRFGIYYDF
ncbi:MAG: hypothetical protein GXO88_05190 [Chlorobi bacterium]|nr:hypothetical protein [Chlorobiota bacterium]